MPSDIEAKLSLHRILFRITNKQLESYDVSVNILIAIALALGVTTIACEILY